MSLYDGETGVVFAGLPDSSRSFGEGTLFNFNNPENADSFEYFKKKYLTMGLKSLKNVSQDKKNSKKDAILCFPEDSALYFSFAMIYVFDAAHKKAPRDIIENVADTVFIDDSQNKRLSALMKNRIDFIIPPERYDDPNHFHLLQQELIDLDVVSVKKTVSFPFVSNPAAYNSYRYSSSTISSSFDANIFMSHCIGIVLDTLFIFNLMKQDMNKNRGYRIAGKQQIKEFVSNREIEMNLVGLLIAYEVETGNYGKYSSILKKCSKNSTGDKDFAPVVVEYIEDTANYYDGTDSTAEYRNDLGALLCSMYRYADSNYARSVRLDDYRSSYYSTGLLGMGAREVKTQKGMSSNLIPTLDNGKKLSSANIDQTYEEFSDFAKNVGHKFKKTNTSMLDYLFLKMDKEPYDCINIVKEFDADNFKTKDSVKDIVNIYDNAGELVVDSSEKKSNISEKEYKDALESFYQEILLHNPSYVVASKLSVLSIMPREYIVDTENRMDTFIRMSDEIISRIDADTVFYLAKTHKGTRDVAQMVYILCQGDEKKFVDAIVFMRNLNVTIENKDVKTIMDLIDSGIDRDTIMSMIGVENIDVEYLTNHLGQVIHLGDLIPRQDGSNPGIVSSFEVTTNTYYNEKTVLAYLKSYFCYSDSAVFTNERETHHLAKKMTTMSRSFI